MTHCVQCGKEIIHVVHTGPKRRFCCRSCEDRHRKAKPSSVTCKHCGRVLNQGQARGKYCSRKCKGMATRSLRGTLRTCVVCGKQFQPKAKRAQCCGLACSMVKRANTSRERF